VRTLLVRVFCQASHIKEVKHYSGRGSHQLRLSDAGKGAVLNVGEERDLCAYGEQYPDASQEAVTKYFSFLWGKPISQRSRRDILSEKMKWRNGRCGSVKRLKGAKHQDVEDELLFWKYRVNAENRTVTDEVIKEQAKVIAHQVAVTDSVYSRGRLLRFK
jgi:hypothetical protein